MNLFIYGSCVSRDALNNPQFPKNICLNGYYSRTSFASQIMSPCSFSSVLNQDIPSFLRRMHAADCGKYILSEIQNADCDIILIDLIDTRFDLIEVGSGNFITATPEVYSSLSFDKRGRLIKSGSSEYIEKWKQGFDLFQTTLCKLGWVGKIRVNKVFWSAAKTEERFNGISDEDISRANEMLDFLYQYISHVCPVKFYCYPKDFFASDPRHPWGYAPFHYIENLYKMTVSHLASDNCDQ